MQISAITLKGFMSHDETDVGLPDRGVVLVTGPNGAGKSTLPEAVSYGLYGRTLRKTPPWRDKTAGLVVIETPTLVAQRKKTAAKAHVSLRWMGPGDKKLRRYERTTEAQAELQDLVGTWDTWRRTCVFSAADAAHFTLATDGERKRLLEVILGLERFDAGLEDCRVDLKKARAEEELARGRIKHLQIQIDETEKRLKDVGEMMLDIPMAADAEVDMTAHAAQTTLLANDVNVLIATTQELVQDRSKANSERGQRVLDLNAAKERLTRVTSAFCPECEQVIPLSLVEEMQDRVDSKALAAEEGEKIARAHTAEIDKGLAELNSKHAEKAKTLAQHLEEGHKAEAKKEAALVADAARLRANERLALVLARQAELAANLKAAKAVWRATNKEMLTLEATETVLGLRGVRAQVLGKTLSGIEAVANFWLAKIAGAGFTLELKPYKERSKGGLTDAISLEVSGPGGGYGYKGSSGGERRRIDIALLLALAEVSQAALRQEEQSTLFFDEVFDALDVQGVAAVSAALTELGRTRTVVVITHSAAMIDNLQPTLRLHVDQGTITATP